MSGSFVLVSGIWKQSMSINEWTAKQIIVNTDNGVWLSGREGKGLVHTRTWMHFKLLCCAKEGRNRRVQMVPFYEILGTEKPSTVTESRAVVVGAGKIGVLTAKNWGRIVGDRNVLFPACRWFFRCQPLSKLIKILIHSPKWIEFILLIFYCLYLKPYLFPKGGHSQWCSRITPDSSLRNHFVIQIGSISGESNQGQGKER